MPEYEPTPCVVCGKPPCLGINRVSYCEDHIQDGFASLKRTLQSLEANIDEPEGGES